MVDLLLDRGFEVRVIDRPASAGEKRNLAQHRGNHESQTGFRDIRDFEPELEGS